METEETNKTDNYENYRTDIVTALGYLLGIKNQYLELETQRFKPEIIEALEKDKNATIIRALSILRNEFMRNCRTIQERNNDFIPLEAMEDILSVDKIKLLRGYDIEIVHVNTDITLHIAYINQEILEHIDSVKSWIPTWIRWEYIKAMFTMPGCYSGHNGMNIQGREQAKRVSTQIHRMRKLFFDNKTFYPYGTYLYWPEEKMKSYYGNILFHDEKMLKLLYSAYNETFHANQYVIDATEEQKDSIYDFVDNAINIAVLVDCENVDPYRFASVFKNLNEENLNKIKKIILYDDVNTSTAWDYIGSMIHIAIEHNEIQRILDNKSLVDMAMATGACKEYYQNNMDSFILVSSDSDFWGLIHSLPYPRYFILNESDKTSTAVIRKLEEENINYCFMDSFAQSEVQDFKNMVLYQALQQKIADFNTSGIFPIMNPRRLVDAIFQEAYIQGSINQLQTEKEAFYKKYLKKGLKVSVIEENDETYFKMELASQK